MPSYRALRAKHSFMELALTPELAAEVTLLPVEELGVDAAILFSDILVILLTLGCKVDFVEGTGPQVLAPERFEQRDVSETLQPVFEALKLLKGTLKVPLLGFAGAPFTVASYLLGGLTAAKKRMLGDPQAFAKLIDLLTELTIEYLVLQAEAGADAVQVFDTWAGELGVKHYRAYSLSPLKRICVALQEKNIPVILFSRKTAQHLPALAALKPTALSVDWTVDLPSLRHGIVSKPIALQGNFDPDLLYCDEKMIRETVASTLEAMQGDGGYIVNLGHGIKPDMEQARVAAFVEAVKEIGACASAPSRI